MRVYHVEPGGVLRHGFEKSGASGRWVGTWPSEAKRLRPYRMELCAGARVPTGEERYLMTETDKFIDQPSHHAFCAAV
jgi:hypothetical protein